MDMELKRLWAAAAALGSCMEGGRGGRRGGPEPHLADGAMHSLCRDLLHFSHLKGLG